MTLCYRVGTSHYFIASPKVTHATPNALNPSHRHKGDPKHSFLHPLHFHLRRTDDNKGVSLLLFLSLFPFRETRTGGISQERLKWEMEGDDETSSANCVHDDGYNRTRIIGKEKPPQVHLNCPRCNSSNTKFCYFNNYSLAQPRYFCKACRRYWTQGGSLRNVPVGGGSRKNKRPSLQYDLLSSSSTMPSSSSPSPSRKIPDFSLGFPPTGPSSASTWSTSALEPLGSGNDHSRGLNDFLRNPTHMQDDPSSMYYYYMPPAGIHELKPPSLGFTMDVGLSGLKQIMPSSGEVNNEHQEKARSSSGRVYWS